MKKIGSLLALLVISGTLSANEHSEPAPQLTLAAVDTTSQQWAAEPRSLASEARLEKTLEEKARVLNEKINAQLEKSLEEKLARELDY